MTELAHRLGYMTEEEKTAVKNLLEKAKLPVEIPEYIDREALVKKLYTDKKVRDGKLRFVVEKGIGGIVEFEEGVFATPVEEAVAKLIGFLKKQEANGKFFSKAMQKETHTDMEEV